MIDAADEMTLADPVLGMRILVVDDEPLNVELLATILDDAGFTEVETTTSTRVPAAGAMDPVFTPEILDQYAPLGQAAPGASAATGYCPTSGLATRARTTAWRLPEVAAATASRS